MPKAELARFIDRWTVEYVRTYPHPIDRVWRAIRAGAYGVEVVMMLHPFRIGRATGSSAIGKVSVSQVVV